MAHCVVVRVWLADRPGSLGQVASKIGDLGGDLVGVDILERDGSRAVDELTIELADGSSPDDVAEALSRLPGVEVEDLRHLVYRVPDADRDPLGAAVLIAESSSMTELLSALGQGVCAAFACDWSTVLDTGKPWATSLAEAGPPPGCGLVGRLRGWREGRSLACRRRCGTGWASGRCLGSARVLRCGRGGRS